MNSRPCPLCHHPHAALFQKVDDHTIVSCKSCDFVFVADLPTPEEEKQRYEGYFESSNFGDYEPNGADREMQRLWRINDRRLQEIKKSIKRGRLLDVGCGRGFFLKHAQLAGFDAEGIEISIGAARYASERWGATVHLCNLDHEPAVDGSYDVITLWHVLEHFQQPVEVLQKLWNLLTPEGRLFVEVPNLNSLKFYLTPPSRRWRGGNHPRYHRSFFTPDTLERSLIAGGFHEIEPYDPGYAPSALKRAIKSQIHRLGVDAFINVTARA